jgi:uncharacterized alpha-E superfamily protein
MLSRVAESMYWMSRYIERAENVARFVDVNLQLMLDLPRGTSEQWQPLVTTTGDHADFEERYGAPTRENVIRFLTFDRENPNAIVSCIRRARENARSVRENISSDMWEQLNTLHLRMSAASEAQAMLDAHDFFQRIRLESHLFVGLTDTTLSHGEGWHFCRLGRNVERADKTSRILDVKYFIILPSLDDLGTHFEDIQWGALLNSASAFEMYRKRYGPIARNAVVAFLLLDREFPRSVLCSVGGAEESLHAISGTPLDTYANRAEQRLGRLRADLAYADADQIIASGLHEFIDGLQVRLNDVGDDVREIFFAMRPVDEGAPGVPGPPR